MLGPSPQAATAFGTSIHRALTALARSPARSPLVLRGQMSKQQRATLIDELHALPPEVPGTLLAAGKLVGEGFDHPPLVVDDN